jgi:hypothetical protein
MHIKALPPELLLRLLDGEQDILTPAVEKQTSRVEILPCLRCKNPLQRHIPVEAAFRANGVPRICGKCEVCGYCVDVETGIVLDVGDASRTKSDPDALHLFSADPTRKDAGE